MSETKDRHPTEHVDRLSAASVGSRALEGYVCLALGQQPEWATKHHAPRQPELWTDGGAGLRAKEWTCPRFTTSLDAALALAERVLPGWYAGMQANRFSAGEPWSFWLEEAEEHQQFERAASTPALAACLAILSAVAAQPADKGSPTDAP